MRGHFFIKAKQPNIITEKGVRAFITEKLLNSPFARGAAINIDDRVVEVQLEGDEQQIKKFKEQLEKEVTTKFGNPIVFFTEFKEDQRLEIPELMRSSQALMVGQLQKGINVQLKILDKLNTLDEIKSGFKELKDELKLELRSLPREIAKAIKEN